MSERASGGKIGDEQMYPVHSGILYQFPDCPKQVPWSLLAPHAAQALKNHSQTLARLAERGGLSPSEIMAIVQDRDFEKPYVPEAEAVAWLKRQFGGETR